MLQKNNGGKNHSEKSNKETMEVYSKFSKDQKLAFEIAQRGENLFVTGSAGTGKSYVLMAIVNQLRANRKIVYVTAATAIAALSVCGITLHRFAGIGVPKQEKLQDLIKKAKVNKSTSFKWRNTNTLVIDEVSMIEPNYFHILDQIARDLRRSEKPFGGMQVIAFGDFFQLPPVPNKNSKEGIDYCFDLPLWRKLFPYCVQLKEVFRQKDPEFVGLLNRVRMGEITQQDVKILESRLKTKVESVKKKENIADDKNDIISKIIPPTLFPDKKSAHALNDKKLSEIKGKCATFSGTFGCIGLEKNEKKAEAIQKSMLEAVPVEHQFDLKIGAQVMSVVNLYPDEGIVNETIGIITDLIDDENLGECIPEVAFQVNGSTEPVVKNIQPYTWDMRDEIEKWGVYYTNTPLRIAFACTIHKAQGVTLKEAVANLGSGVFADGQSYVALSRVRTLDGLYLLDFYKNGIRANPIVKAFYRMLDENTDIRGRVNYKDFRITKYCDKTIEPETKKLKLSSELQRDMAIDEYVSSIHPIVFSDLGIDGYHALSLFSIYGFSDGKTTYKSCQHYIQYKKYMEYHKELAEAIIEAKAPEVAASIGESEGFKPREDWDNVKRQMLYECCLLKFQQNEIARKVLLSTEDSPILYKNLNDPFLGIGPDFKGENALGAVLVRVRSELTSNQNTNTIKS